MQISVARQDVMDLKEIVGRHAENLDQRILNRRRHFPETGLVILAFEHVNLCERHVFPRQERRRGGVAGFSSTPWCRRRPRLMFSAGPASRLGGGGCLWFTPAVSTPPGR